MHNSKKNLSLQIFFIYIYCFIHIWYTGFGSWDIHQAKNVYLHILFKGMNSSFFVKSFTVVFVCRRSYMYTSWNGREIVISLRGNKSKKFDQRKGEKGGCLCLYHFTSLFNYFIAYSFLYSCLLCVYTPVYLYIYSFSKHIYCTRKPI